MKTFRINNNTIINANLISFIRYNKIVDAEKKDRWSVVIQFTLNNLEIPCDTEADAKECFDKIDSLLAVL